MKVIKSFKLLHPEHEYPTMYSKLDDNRHFKTQIQEDGEMIHIEIPMIEYASAYANFLIITLEDDE
jgi:hypothetical protein